MTRCQLRLLVMTTAALSGCATTSEEAARSMRGMTRAEVLACAGAPNNEAVDGTLRVMSYTRMNVIQGTSAECTVSVILRRDTLDAVRYSGAPGVCSRLIAGCMKR